MTKKKPVSKKIDAPLYDELPDEDVLVPEVRKTPPPKVDRLRRRNLASGRK